MISKNLSTQTSEFLDPTYPFIQPKFLSVKQENLNQFFKNLSSSKNKNKNQDQDYSCLQWMLLSFCNNDTDFFKKLRHELFNLLITENLEGIREVNQNNILNILEFGKFLQVPRETIRQAPVESLRDREISNNQNVMMNYECQ